MKLLRAGAGATLACLMAIGAAVPARAQAQIDDYIGQIDLFATDFCPQGTLPADGRTLQIRDYQALFALIVNAYGGDGLTDFNLPDLSDKAPVGGTRYCIVVDGVYPTR